MKLSNATFCLGDKPMRNLLWCNKQARAKRNKPSKINGIQHHEISVSVGDDQSSLEHAYYQPVQ